MKYRFKGLAALIILAAAALLLIGCARHGGGDDSGALSSQSNTSSEGSSEQIKEEIMTKKIACLGDSITNLGEGINTYVDFLGDDTLELITQNVGLSGSALAIPDGVGANPALSERYVSISDDSEVILIFGGSNDFGHSDFPARLGDVDSDSTDRHDFCGALRYLITTLRREHPNALIVYATPMRRNDARWYASIGHNEPATGVNRYGFRLEDYRNAGIAICEKLDCPVIDLFNHPDLNPEIPENDTKYYRDGLHLNDDGAKLLAAHFTKELKALLNK